MSSSTDAALPSVHLHVSHAFGGGIDRWVRDFALADPHNTHLYLQSTGMPESYGLGLRLVELPAERELGRWELAQPITEVRDRHPEYLGIVQRLCDAHGVDQIIVSSLAGHALELFRLGVPVTQVHHDFFPHCPAWFVYRRGICRTCTHEDLATCHSSNPHHKPWGSADYHMALRDAYFEAVHAAGALHVSPSAGLPQKLRQLDHRWDAIDFAVIEHGLGYHKRNLFGGAEEGRRLRVGVLGQLSWHKGRHQLIQLFERTRGFLDFYFLGADDHTLGERFGMTYVERYTRQELPDLLERFRLDLMLFLPIVPESFSYTLSESWCFCIPPMIRPVGAFGERVAEGHDGFFVSPHDDSVVDLLLEVDQKRDLLRAMAGRLSRKPVWSRESAAGDYYRLWNTHQQWNANKEWNASSHPPQGVCA